MVIKRVIMGVMLVRGVHGSWLGQSFGQAKHFLHIP